MKKIAAVFALIMSIAVSAFAQQAAPLSTAVIKASADVPEEKTEKKEKDAEQIGFALPNSDRLRVRFSLMAGYGHDDAQAELGFEKQGRVGYALIEAFGKIADNVKYRVAINPVNETEPRAACGQDNYFYPNSAEFLGTAGPNYACAEDGNRRVDMYKYMALDWYNQQGPIREAYITYLPTKSFSVDFGRFILNKGFAPEEVGSMSSKDSPRIQRINAETNFGVRFGWKHQSEDRKKPLVAVAAAAFLGDGNRNKDYSYFYFERGDLDSNSALTALYTATISPFDALDLRVAMQRGLSGSKVERLPHYFASKRNDHALVLSGRYQVIPQIALFGEMARYTWGITATSAEMLGFNQEPVNKNGYYAGIEASQKIGKVLFGGSFTMEEISRDDSLVRYLVESGASHVSLGEKDRGKIARFFVEAAGVRVGFYRNADETPFPWVSGISPFQGDRAMQSRGTSKWGLIVRATLQ